MPDQDPTGSLVRRWAVRANAVAFVIFGISAAVAAGRLIAADPADGQRQDVVPLVVGLVVMASCVINHRMLKRHSGAS